MGIFGILTGFFLIIILVLVAVFFIPKIFFLLTLQKTLDAVSFKNRKMPSGQVWLLLIPFFGLVWNFIVVNNIAESLQLEFADRGIRVDEYKPSYNMGLVYAILMCSLLLPTLNFITPVALLIIWIIYWVKVDGYKTRLEQLNRLHPNNADGL